MSPLLGLGQSPAQSRLADRLIEPPGQWFPRKLGKEGRDGRLNLLLIV